MVNLVPMTITEFNTFMKISMQDHAQSQVQAGYWNAGEANKNILQLRQQILPDGLSTPDHYFFSIQDEPSKLNVGGLWFAVMEKEGQRFVFVVDIQIFEPYRRHGYGEQAFILMEDKARDLGISTIALNVFEHNHPARAMYVKLGYQGIEEQMMKTIS